MTRTLNILGLLCLLLLGAIGGAGAQNNGTVGGTVAYAASSAGYGQAAVFTTTPFGTVTLGNALSFPSGSSWTVELRLKNPLGVVLSKGWYLYFQSANNYQFTLGGGSGYTPPTGINLADGNYHTMVLECVNGTTAKTYIDGILASTASCSYVLSSNAAILGANDINGGFSFSGSVDEIRTTAAALYSSNYTPAATPFANSAVSQVALYHLDGNVLDSNVVVPSAAVSPTSIMTGAGNVTLTYTGSNTAWTASTVFTLGMSAGAAGASIVSQSVNAASQVATIVVAPGTGTGTLTLTNNTDSTATSLSVSQPVPMSAYSVGVSSSNGTSNAPVTLTLTSTGTPNGTLTVTPAMTGLLGTFSKASLTITASALSDTLTFSPATTGTGVLSFTHTYTGTGGNSQVSAPASTTLEFLSVLGVGDSITAGFTLSAGQAPGIKMSARLQTLHTPAGWLRFVTYTNAGVSGTTSVQWATNGNTYLSSAISAAQSAVPPATTCVVMLGTNDTKPSSPPTSPAAYAANIRTIDTALLGAGIKKILLEGAPYLANAGTADLQTSGNPYLVSYADQLSLLADNVNTFFGDTTAYDFFSIYPAQLGDGVHPNAVGAQMLGDFWAQLLWRTIYAPPAGTILTLTITRNGSSQPVLTWTADPAATLYKVYRSTDGANYTVIATPATGTLTYTDTARPAGATVYYHITSTH